MENRKDWIHERVIHKNHVTISLGTSRWWLSLAHVDDLGDEIKELALVEITPESGYRDTRCVPLSVWFDHTCAETEVAIDLFASDYSLLENVSEGQIIAEAIGRAMSYVNSVRK